MSSPKSFFSIWFSRNGWAVVTALCVFLVTGFIDARAMVRAHHLNAEGAQAIAEEIETWTTRSHRRNGASSTHYHARFRFIAADGRSYEVEQRISRQFYEERLAGLAQPVRYWTEDPRLAEIEPGSNSSTAVKMTLVALAALVVGSVLSWTAWATARDAVWLREHGERQEATVTDQVKRRALSWPSLGRMVWEDRHGASGTSWLRPMRDLAGIGETITLLVDPDRRRAPIWEGEVFDW